MDKKEKDEYSKYVGFGMIMGVAIGFGLGSIILGPIAATDLCRYRCRHRYRHRIDNRSSEDRRKIKCGYLTF